MELIKLSMLWISSLGGLVVVAEYYICRCGWGDLQLKNKRRVFIVLSVNHALVAMHGIPEEDLSV